MTQEDKKLLLKDLCARLPYGVIVDPVDCGKAILVGIKDGGLLLFDTIRKKEYDKPWDIEYIKPYLRPISSITRGEKEEFEQIRYNAEAKLFNAFSKGGFTLAFHEINDWLNAHHFDYRGLIGKDLAIAVDENNNPYDI